MASVIKKPLVTILLPVYNGEKYLRDAIQSVLDQTYKDFEFLIINDCSSDKTDEIVKSFDDPRIRYIVHNENKRLIYTLNEGISLANGKYLARIDADDLAFNTRIEEQVSFLEKNLDYVLIGTKVNLIKDDQNTDETIDYFTDDVDLKFALCFYNPFVHPSIMMRLEIIQYKNLFFDYNFVHAEDYEFWTRLSIHGKIANLNTTLNFYRIHNNQISNIYADIQQDQTNRIQLKYLNNILNDFTEDERLSIFNHKTDFISSFKIESLLKFSKSIKLDGPAKKRYIVKEIKQLIFQNEDISLHLLIRSLLFLSFNRDFLTSRQLIRLFKKFLFS